jgi:hypothetical protein
MFLMEVKTDDGRLMPEQVKFHQSWRGQTAIVRSVDEALMIATGG